MLFGLGGFAQGGGRQFGALPPAFVGCRLRRSTVQSIPDANFTEASFDIVEFDTHGFFLGGKYPTRMFFPLAGKYLVYGHGRFAIAGTSARRLALIKNTGPFQAVYAATSSADLSTALGVATVIDVKPRDYVELAFWQNHGSNINLLAETSGPVLGCVWLGR